MIIISTGLPKSGSTLIFNCQGSMIRKTSQCGQEKLYKSLMGNLSGMLKWQHFSKVYMMKYEDFMQDLHHELSLMDDFLGLHIQSEEIQLITKEVNQKKQNSWNFNKGTTNRYQIEMTD